MTEGFEQYWVVDKEDDMFKLLEIGWELVKILPFTESEWESGFWSSKRVYHTESHFLMRKPKGIIPREKNKDYFHSWEDVEKYVERVSILKEGKQA